MHGPVLATRPSVEREKRDAYLSMHAPPNLHRHVSCHVSAPSPLSHSQARAHFTFQFYIKIDNLN